ncbi:MULTISPECIES: ribonuclease P protein component [Arcobacter]|uniref:Ribonuclease P protein component n=2 Tax=Arcobacter ellisii TaxID=913109 RepID=A0ABM6YKU5_9BACT|nr:MULTISPECIES: ribonuclease P protein component [Arcobacter]AXX95653.1 ribonuclease P, protein component [Arcobacter ellisii]MBD3829630.1 ribonuclease P protein component [Arcobacter sp.]MDD3008026.1 ribonuclease P protein component [Arcobacter sp.]MDY3203840.1 ribonuclease P protein component [Arcobacter sp.]
MSCLSKDHRLNSPKDFNRLYKSGKRWHTASFVAFFSSSPTLKAAFVTSKKVGNAVNRNKARRRMRALFASYEKQLLVGNYIFVAKITLHEKNYLELKKDFDFALKRLEVLK